MMATCIQTLTHVHEVANKVRPLTENGDHFSRETDVPDALLNEIYQEDEEESCGLVVPLLARDVSELACFLKERPHSVVFVMVIDQRALKVFEVKSPPEPFNETQFQPRTLATLSEQETLERLIIRSDGRIVFLRVDEIDWLQTVGNYVRVHVGNDAHLVRATMTGMEARLDPDKFLRIHRSIIVNVDRIREAQPLVKGEHVIILRDKTRLIMSRRYRERLNGRLTKLL